MKVKTADGFTAISQGLGTVRAELEYILATFCNPSAALLSQHGENCIRRALSEINTLDRSLGSDPETAENPF